MFHGIRITDLRTFVFIDSSGTICVSIGGDTHAVASLDATTITVNSDSEYIVDCRTNISFLLDRADSNSGEGDVVLSNPVPGKVYSLIFRTTNTDNYAGINFPSGTVYAGNNPNVDANTTDDIIKYTALYIGSTWYVEKVLSLIHISEPTRPY